MTTDIFPSIQPVRIAVVAHRDEVFLTTKKARYYQMGARVCRDGLSRDALDAMFDEGTPEHRAASLGWETQAASGVLS